MALPSMAHRTKASRPTSRLLSLAAVVPLALGTACASSSGAIDTSVTAPAPSPSLASMSTAAPSPDPRVGLRAGLMNAEDVAWNLRVVSETPPPADFLGVTNSDLAFTGKYAIQGNYNGWQIWDISNPASPQLVSGFVCPASQSDVSVYGNLLFISGEGLTGRLDCGTQGVPDAVSAERLRGLRIFDITDIRNPVNVGNVQTCRGSHTHTVLKDPRDNENVYVYISGSAGIRSSDELEGCETGMPGENPNSALFRIEVIKVPLANPAAAAIVSSPRIFNDLEAPPRHGDAPADAAANRARVAQARAAGAFIMEIDGTERVLNPRITQPMLDSIVKARNGTGAPTSRDSAALRQALPSLVSSIFGGNRARTGPTQCHDITVYPEIGLAGGACEGYGLLLDISDPANPVRIGAVADSNFSYWHSATFSNDGSKVIFTDEWGGGSQPKCRASDPKEWGADAIFTLQNRRMEFQSYYKLPAAQTEQENCVAHNGSLIPIPGRDIMVQAWYQGGVSVFEFTDPKNPVEIAYHDRGPVDSLRMQMGGSWSVYWYNGAIYSSEIARGLDVYELMPSGFISQNEIDAARTVTFDQLNPQGQPAIVFPPSFALARAYLDQLERNSGMQMARITAVRQALVAAERASLAQQRTSLTALASQLESEAGGARDGAKVRDLASAVRKLAGS
ncbi:MAG TPA: hypothetical protein VKZ41_13110 [Gemmatimonadales bacterium]|nr:hypothetical protein [Gemmatimonadales bacterium]